MNSKERVHRAIARKPIDRVPLDCWLHEQRFCDPETRIRSNDYEPPPQVFSP